MLQQDLADELAKEGVTISYKAISNLMAVTNNIREIREQRGIYQNDLAAAIGFSTKTVGRIGRGDSTPSAEFMLRISKYFNLLVEDVFHVED